MAIQIPGGKTGAFYSTGGGVNSDQDTELSKATGSSVAIVFDVGQRVNRMFYWGLQLAYAPSMSQPDCMTECKVTNFKIGADAMIHPHVEQLPPKVDPYLGFGVNYDQLTVAADSSAPVSVYGMEFMNIQIGADYLAARHVSIGGYFATSFGMYFGADLSNTKSVELHEWFTLGVRGAFRP